MNWLLIFEVVDMLCFLLCLQLDLVDMDCVRQFVREFSSLNKQLFALINNAGIMMPRNGTEREVTKDGFEVTMTANYLGNFSRLYDRV